MHSKIMFSVNEYDRDGDIIDKGVFLHFGDTRVKACDTIKEFSDVLKYLESMRDELEKEYSGEA